MRQFRTAPAPHVIGSDPVPRVMRDVLLALIPAVLIYAWFFGPGQIINMLIASAVALACEAAMLRLRRSCRWAGFSLAAVTSGPPKSA